MSTKFGPVGGSGGSNDFNLIASSGEKIVEINIWHGNYIDGFQVILSDGTKQKYGGTGGHRPRLDFSFPDDEFVTGISGKHGTYLDSLIVHTNKRQLPVAGGGGGTFDYGINVPRIEELEVVGFFGKSGKYMDNLGCYIRKNSKVG